ncbi:hypothetical protein GGR52DRAFT_511624 [Hypoxylon sp. FL1284]|nr:hypothetical protein GGR52DRAFT_511624 [Hypoxylon sp. FL1284]
MGYTKQHSDESDTLVFNFHFSFHLTYPISFQFVIAARQVSVMLLFIEGHRAWPYPDCPKHRGFGEEVGRCYLTSIIFSFVILTLVTINVIVVAVINIWEETGSSKKGNNKKTGGKGHKPPSCHVFHPRYFVFASVRLSDFLVMLYQSCIHQSV